MERRFREDENELPYLVWESDEPKGIGDNSYLFKKDFENIDFREFSSYVRRLMISDDHKDSIIASVEVNARNCKFSIHQNGDDIRFSFTVANEYVKTEIDVRYNPDLAGMERYGGYTYHDGLESKQWFKEAVREIENETGRRYEFCFNGHDFTCRGGRLVINDSYETMVMFEKDGDSDHYAYKVDFALKELREYHTYPFHEYFTFFG